MMRKSDDNSSVCNKGNESFNGEKSFSSSNAQKIEDPNTNIVYKNDLKTKSDDGKTNLLNPPNNLIGEISVHNPNKMMTRSKFKIPKDLSEIRTATNKKFFNKINKILSTIDTSAINVLPTENNINIQTEETSSNDNINIKFPDTDNVVVDNTNNNSLINR